MSDLSPFFQLHSDLPREGPGLPSDVAWATRVAQLKSDAVICDAACGPGADVAALLEAAPNGHVTGIDGKAHFIAAAQARYAGETRADFRQGDMASLGGAFDFIWCAGALYFLGLLDGLTAWRSVLTPEGAIAFSHPCYFTDSPSAAAQAFWEGEGKISTEAEIQAEIAPAGYTLIDARKLSDAAWDAYNDPMQARIDKLRQGAEPALLKILENTQADITSWPDIRSETGYLLCVVRPV